MAAIGCFRILLRLGEQTHSLVPRPCWRHVLQRIIQEVGLDLAITRYFGLQCFMVLFTTQVHRSCASNTSKEIQLMQCVQVVVSDLWQNAMHSKPRPTVVHERSFSKIGPWCRRERIVELGVILSLEVRRPVSAIHVNVMSFEKIRRCLREVVLSINMVYHRFQIGTVDTDNQSHYHHRFSSQTFRTRHVPRNRRIHFTCCH